MVTFDRSKDQDLTPDPLRRYSSLIRSLLLIAVLVVPEASHAQALATAPVLTATAAPSAPSAMATTRPAEGHLAPGYLLAPEDTIAINVWKEPALSGTVPIRPDGMISLPLLGDVRAAGSTPMSLSDEISARLKKFVTDPRVTVTVMTVHRDKVFLLGEVLHAGEVPLTPGMSPIQAIAAAGGLTVFANSKHIYILRKQQRVPFNYRKALKGGDDQGVALMAGDTIVVP